VTLNRRNGRPDGDVLVARKELPVILGTSNDIVPKHSLDEQRQYVRRGRQGGFGRRRLLRLDQELPTLALEDVRLWGRRHAGFSADDPYQAMAAAVRTRVPSGPVRITANGTTGRPVSDARLLARALTDRTLLLEVAEAGGTERGYLVTANGHLHPAGRDRGTTGRFGTLNPDLEALAREHRLNLFDLDASRGSATLTDAVIAALVERGVPWEVLNPRPEELLQPEVPELPWQDMPSATLTTIVTQVAGHQQGFSPLSQTEFGASRASGNETGGA
jgi:hypothetical protein